MKCVLSSRAEADTATAIRYYDSIQHGIGLDFVHELETTLENVREWPHMAEAVRPNIRRAVMQRFHYNVVYRVDIERVLVLRVFPQAMDPARLAHLSDFDED